MRILKLFIPLMFIFSFWFCMTIEEFVKQNPSIKNPKSLCNKSCNDQYYKCINNNISESGNDKIEHDKHCYDQKLHCEFNCNRS